MHAMNSPAREIVLFGATGSIGGSCADLLREPNSPYRLVAATAHRRGEGLAALAREFDVSHLQLDDAAAADEIFATLMGEDVESRRSFIQKNAKDVRFLDI